MINNISLKLHILIEASSKQNASKMTDKRMYTFELNEEKKSERIYILLVVFMNSASINKFANNINFQASGRHVPLLSEIHVK